MEDRPLGVKAKEAVDPGWLEAWHVEEKAGKAIFQGGRELVSIKGRFLIVTPETAATVGLTLNTVAANTRHTVKSESLVKRDPATAPVARTTAPKAWVPLTSHSYLPLQ